MIVECCMCNEELCIEEIKLCGDKALVMVWPCEQCREYIAEWVIREVDES